MSYSLVMVKATHNSIFILRIFVPKISYNLLYMSSILPISSSSFHSSILPSLISSSFSSSLIFSNLSFPFPFYFFLIIPNIVHQISCHPIYIAFLPYTYLEIPISCLLYCSFFSLPFQFCCILPFI